MLILTDETRVDPFGEAFEKSKEIFIPWSINPRRPKDEDRKFMRMGKSQLFSHTFALAVKGNRFTGIGLLFFIPISTGSCRCLARNIDEFLKTRIIFETGMDQVLGSKAVYFKIRFLSDGLRHTG
jgi:hypothetical protein